MDKSCWLHVINSFDTDARIFGRFLESPGMATYNGCYGWDKVEFTIFKMSFEEKSYVATKKAGEYFIALTFIYHMKGCWNNSYDRIHNSILSHQI